MNKLSIILAFALSGCVSNKYPYSKSQGVCEFSEEQNLTISQNIVTKMKTEMPDHSKYCNLEKKFSFERVEGRCRTYLECSEKVDNTYLLHGDIFIYIDEVTLDVTGIYDVAW